MWIAIATAADRRCRWARRHGAAGPSRFPEPLRDQGPGRLWQLVVDGDEDMATYYALRSDARDTDVIVDDVDEVEHGHDSTTLIESLRVGYLEVAKCLLERDADVNEANTKGETPLYWASCTGHVEVVKALLAAEAEVNKADNHGRTPLFWAVFYGTKHGVAGVLREAGGHE